MFVLLNRCELNLLHRVLSLRRTTRSALFSL